MSCEFCERLAEENIECCIAGEDFVEPNFCPMCGTPLTEPEPLTVEELLAMRRVRPGRGYDPVWVKTISDGKVSCVIANKLFRTDYRYKTPKTWADAHRVNLPLDDYGKTWVAYDRKPKEVTADG